tara:strand:- start:3550 stop:4773 length:1224 start_codon:yes stop_codon:yes gene_type:complete
MALKILSSVYILSLFFPYTFLGIGSSGDLQPYNILIGFFLSSVYILAKITKKTTLDKWVIVPIIIILINTIVLILFSELDVNLIRGIGAYANFSVLLISSFIALKYSDKVVLKIVIISAILWNAIGIVQLFFDREFLTFLVNRTVITDDRGVISLSPEPSYYALMCCVTSAIIFVYGQKKLALILLSPVVFLAKSSVISLFLVFSMLLYLLILGNKFTRVLLFVLLTLISLFFMNGESISIFLSGIDLSSLGRLGLILENFDKIFYFFIDDQSINTRLTHIYYSIYGFVENYGIPRGSSIWPEYINSKANGPILWSDGLETTERINSGLGQPLFELGFFSLTIFYVFYSCIKYNVDDKERLWLLCSVLLFMINTLSISYPPLTLLMAIMLKGNKFDTCCSTQRLRVL